LLYTAPENPPAGSLNATGVPFSTHSRPLLLSPGWG